MPLPATREEHLWSIINILSHLARGTSSTDPVSLIARAMVDNPPSSQEINNRSDTSYHPAPRSIRRTTRRRRPPTIYIPDEVTEFILGRQPIRSYQGRYDGVQAFACPNCGIHGHSEQVCSCGYLFPAFIHVEVYPPPVEDSNIEPLAPRRTRFTSNQVTETAPTRSNPFAVPIQEDDHPQAPSDHRSNTPLPFQDPSLNPVARQESPSASLPPYSPPHHNADPISADPNRSRSLPQPVRSGWVPIRGDGSNLDTGVRAGLWLDGHRISLSPTGRVRSASPNRNQ
jgi:hypothetical protein